MGGFGRFVAKFQLVLVEVVVALGVEGPGGDLLDDLGHWSEEQSQWMELISEVLLGDFQCLKSLRIFIV